MSEKEWEKIKESIDNSIEIIKVQKAFPYFTLEEKKYIEELYNNGYTPYDISRLMPQSTYKIKKYIKSKLS